MNRAHDEYVAASITPHIRTNVLMELLEDDTRVEFARTNGTLSVEWIARRVHGRKPTHLELCQAAAILRSEGWKQETVHTWSPPRDHEIKLGPYMSAFYTLTPHQQQIAVGSKVPPMYQERCVEYLTKHPRGRPRNKHQLYEAIAEFKSEFMPVAKKDPDDEELRDILMEWLASSEAADLMNSRKQRYITGKECVEGAWMVDPTMIELRRVGRLMPWPRKYVSIDGSSRPVYVHPDTQKVPRPAPPMDALSDYLTTVPDDLCLYEQFIKEKVLKIPLGHRSDSKHISEFMAGRGWKRKNSKHGLGSFYTRAG